MLEEVLVVVVVLGELVLSCGLLTGTEGDGSTRQGRVLSGMEAPGHLPGFGDGGELDSDIHAAITAGPSWEPSQDGQEDFRVAIVYLTTPRHQTWGQ